MRHVSVGGLAYRPAVNPTHEHRRHVADRLAEQRLTRVRAVGGASVEDYLRHRYIEQGWTVHAIGVELRTGRRVLPRLVDAAGVPRRRPGGAGRRDAGTSDVATRVREAARR
jgi:hypothetical protein